MQVSVLLKLKYCSRLLIANVNPFYNLAQSVEAAEYNEWISVEG